jgi:shikimate kinase
MVEQNRALIRKLGVSVWLKASLEVLWQRVRHKDTRPLLRTSDPFGTLKALADAREPVYGSADLIVDSDADQAIEEMASKVLERLRAHPGVLQQDA